MLRHAIDRVTTFGSSACRRPNASKATPGLEHFDKEAIESETVVSGGLLDTSIDPAQVENALLT